MINLISLHSCPRSGSSWLTAIFNSHPNIKIAYQPLFSYEFKNIINNNSSEKEFNIFIQKLYNTNNKFINMNEDYQGGYPKYKKEYINTIFMKNVHHHNLIEKFIKLNPNIKIIGLIRNPINVINSQIYANKEKLIDWLNGNDKNIDDYNFFGFNNFLETVIAFSIISSSNPLFFNNSSAINCLENPLLSL